MKRLWMQLLSALLVCAMLATCGALAESIDVEEPVEELDEFIIGGDDGQSIEGIGETEPVAEEEPAMIEVGFDGDVIASDVGETVEFGSEGDTGLVGEGEAPKDAPKASYYTRLPNSGKYSTLTFTLGDSLLIMPDFASSAGVYVTGFTSSKPGVASIDSRGWITTYKEGTTKITVTTSNKKIKATMKLKIVDPYKPSKIYINQGKQGELCLNQYIQLSTRLEPVSARATLTWTSSKPAVATVDANGRVTARGEGSAKITVKTHNGKKASFKVKVEGIVVNPNVRYRALLIGECDFPSSGSRAQPGQKNVALMQNMLNSLRGPQGNNWVVRTGFNRTNSQIKSDINSAFAGATSSDVSLFYISTHGNKSITYSSNYYGAGFLETYNGSLSLHELAGWLNAVPGKVIVLIDSCGSGASIYPYGSVKGAAGDDFNPESFNADVIDAFSCQDKGVMAPMDRDRGAFVLSNKFYVMTAASYLEYSWYQFGKYSYFTKWLTDGVKTKGKMPADGNKNKFLTLDELYQFVKKKADKTSIRNVDDGLKYKQHVQVYPAYSSFELFYRKK